MKIVRVNPLLEGYKGAVSLSRRFAIPSTVLSPCPVSFVKTCSVPADTVPQCLSHAGNSTNPFPPRVAWPRPIPFLDLDRVPTHY